MLTLNIKSSSYMCLDIDPDSVIHKHLVKKIWDLDKENAYIGMEDESLGRSVHNEIVLWDNDPEVGYYDSETSKHNLTMLPSFHISLGVPQDYIKSQYYTPQNEEWRVNHNLLWHTRHLDILPIIGDITLAEICISEKDGKKSAWIPLEPAIISNYINNEEAQLSNKTILTSINLEKEYDSFDHRCDELPVQHLHVSVANLTGNPHDSIGRPEDCIVETIRKLNNHTPS